MCGISGIVCTDSKAYSDSLDKMVASLHHRGPDAKGVYYFDQCSLGHARLSIVDLERGTQPMLNRSKNIGITFNGEIYGYKDLKKQLLNYSFQTASDTEVIIALYETYGKEFLQYLPGAFAFGLWDDRDKTLMLARDRFGEKPLYYAVTPKGEFIFASEIKAILAAGLIEPILSSTSVAHYLQHLYVHPYSTIYENIHVLPAAHQLVYSDGIIKISKYWQFATKQETVTMTDAVEQFQFLLEDSVKKQLIADVPVAAFLSGGLDSSTIVSIASRYSTNISTISFGFGDSINELPLARKSAKKYQTNHIELNECDYDLADLLAKMQTVYDEPLADSSNIPTYIISKLASRYAKVVLTGDGGDELLGGYSYWYQPLLNINDFRKNSAKQKIRILLFAALNSYWPLAAHRVFGKHFNGFQLNSIAEAHTFQNTYFKVSEINHMGIDIASTKDYGIPLTNTVADAMRMDLIDYMPGDILVKIDRASMANSLELRAPFLDVKLAEFCINLPVALKLNKDTSKIILRKAFEDKWINELKTIPKQGFGAPVNLWLKDRKVIQLKQEYLFDKSRKIYDLLDSKEFSKSINTDDYKTWILLVLSMWLESHKY